MITGLSRVIAAALSALILTHATVRAADGWTEDFEKAKAAAAKDGRDLLMDFTGSDWCGYCIQLQKEVFSKKAFKSEAPKHFVLVELDFPQEKKQSGEVKAQNEKLQKLYNIDGYPTIILADASGRPYAVTGYEEGGPAKYIEMLAELRKIRETRDAGLKKAAAAEGPEKAKLIMAALEPLDDGVVHTFYAKEIDEAIAADKDDTSGAKKAREKFNDDKTYKDKVAALEEDLGKLHEAGKFDQFSARIDKFVADEKLTGLRKQEILMAKLVVNGPDKLAASQKLLDEIIAIDPKSEAADQARIMKGNLKEMAEQVEKSKKDGAEPDGAPDEEKDTRDGKDEKDEAKSRKEKGK